MNDATAFYDYERKKARARLGKSAEESVKDAFQALKDVHGDALDFARVPDTRSVGAKAIIGSRVGDYEAYFRGEAVFVEVKETAAVRLPKANFKKGQISRGYKRWLAGCIVVVVVRMTATDRWHVVPLKDLFENPQPSWDMAPYPSFDTAKKAIAHVFKAVI